jgi:hypothetical protein
MVGLAALNERVARLQEALDEPFLVTNPKNVFYLSGFRSSNAALVVERERVRLFTDFRYREAAAGVEAVELVETPRSLVAGIGQNVEGRVAFESATMTYANWRALTEAGLELVPTTGVVEKLRAVKSEDELAKIRDACAITDAVYGAIAEEPFVGRSERELAWKMEQLVREQGADALAFELIVGSGPTGARPLGPSPPTRLSSSTRAASSTATRPTARARLRPASSRTISRVSTRSARRRSETRWRPCARARAAPTSTRSRARRSRLPAGARSTGTASATASASSCTKRRCFVPSRKTSSSPATW